MGAVETDKELREIGGHYLALLAKVPLRPIATAAQYDDAVAVLNRLLDAGAADESHALADLAAVLGILIADYDDLHFRRHAGTPVDALRFLMEQHRLSQADLPEVGSQGVVSEILNGKRSLNARQIKALVQRFKVSGALFL
ncbi:helix-turn-helix domain-containing protein [Janthinobacterium agaricidamnosum]|uniref:Uncharacterized HTH-type transcriptional regulator ygjM n=1 Tax=Janthinobacterium agaricidamnosum NBRC 102515 = DSM 9628 TaxID=1349767 RepID=W0VB66_9BURK|nr:transcriptional regulator [Janthinobacterium agaricidamnosum]CDG85121.1 uncharacterized HTH-type transcriptional regulator ygjM [Janthinobacterium agaricidamnosum NBRC 102515 = DSM 9628]